MPYITKAQKHAVWDSVSKTIWSEWITSAGELNFAFTQLIIEYLELKGLNYQNINDVMGALEGAKLEMYRRVAAPYEDKKIDLNGDVYEKKEDPKTEEDK